MRSIGTSMVLIAATSSGVLAQEAGGADQLVAQGLAIYARMAGRLADCGEGPGTEGVEAFAEEISSWRHPGLLDGLLGARGGYRDGLLAAAMLEFQGGQRDGCGLSPAPWQSMIGQVEGTLRQILAGSPG